MIVQVLLGAGGAQPKPQNEGTGATGCLPLPASKNSRKSSMSLPIQDPSCIQCKTFLTLEPLKNGTYNISNNNSHSSTTNRIMVIPIMTHRF